MMQPKNPPPDNTHYSVLLMLLVALAIAVGVAVKRTHDIRAQAATEAAASWDGNYENLTLSSCDREAGAYCSEFAHGDSAMLPCLGRHLKQLSSACSEYVEMVDPPDDWNHVCRSELATVCAGRSRKIACLKENRRTLSTRCLELVDAFAAASGWRNACFDDAARLCPNSAGDETSAGRCLQEHLDNLSISCRTFYASSH